MRIFYSAGINGAYIQENPDNIQETQQFLQTVGKNIWLSTTHLWLYGFCSFNIFIKIQTKQ